MNTKKSARIFLLVLLGLMFVSLIGVVLGADANNDGYDDATGEYLGIGPDNSKTVPISGSELATGFKKIGSEIQDFIEILFGPTVLGDESLSLLFMAMLIAMFVYTVFESFFSGQSPYIKWGATIAATALAITGLPPEFLEAIRTGYGAMGATILSVIPFLIIFWFSVKTKSLALARITWLFYTIYYLLLTGSSLFYKATIDNVEYNTLSYPYLAAFIAGLCIFIFIKGIRKKWFANIIESQLEQAGNKVKRRAAAQLVKDEDLSASTGIKVNE